MKIEVKVIPKARQNFIKQEGSLYKVYLTAPALEGRANGALVALLCEHFAVSKSRITIIKGLKSRYKIVMINPSFTDQVTPGPLSVSLRRDKTMLTNRTAQSTIEYVILITVVIVVVLAIAADKGVFREGLNKTYEQSINGMVDMSNRLYETMKNF